jgi:hypothetical protein
MDLLFALPSIALLGIVTFLFGTGYVEPAHDHRSLRR